MNKREAQSVKYWPVEVERPEVQVEFARFTTSSGRYLFRRIDAKTSLK